MAKAIAFIIGGVEIAAGIVVEILAPGNALGWYLIAAGIGTVLGGVGTLLTQPQGGLTTAARNPTMPWNVIYGQTKTGGTIIYIHSHGDKDKYLDIVIVLASHPCQSVDALLFDNQRVPINPANNTSYSPTQHTVNISSIVRSQGVVTVTLAATIGELQDGDQVEIVDVSGTGSSDRSLNGRYYVTVIDASHFTYLSGGLDVSLGTTGHVNTLWPDYRSKVYCEFLLGYQTETFWGMLNGTPYDGDTGDLVTLDDNPWTNQHLLNGRTAAFLRLHYNDEVFSSGVPQISFRVHGKRDIYDPRNDTVIARPTVLMNGWGHNAHEGPYEGGIDLGYTWGLNDDTTYSYDNPELAVDGSFSSYASSLHRHTHKYAGCIWAFGATTGATTLSILSEVPSSGPGSLRSAGIYYSLDGGSTWTMVYDAPTRGQAWDNIALPGGQDTSLVQVMAFLDSHDDETQRVYDIHLGTSPANLNGYTENAALCIADYLSNNVWGFRARYGTEIPAAQLITAANICDETVPLAGGGSEPRYTCNGQFQLSSRRGEILQNMLTSCGGRITYSGGQFVIWPAAWPGISWVIGTPPVASATLSLLSSHIPGTGYTGVALGNTGTIALIGGTTPFLYDGSAWTNRIDTAAMDPADTANWHCTLGIDGSLFGSASPPDQFLIYDCWIDVTYADGSTGVWRATFPQVIPSIPVGAGDVLDPANASDGDTASYTTIERYSFASTGRTAYLRLSQFVPFGGSGPPDTTTGGMTTSAVALSEAAGPFTWKSKVAIRDLYNGVKGTFISPANGWQNSDFPPYAQDSLHGYSGPSAYEGDANLAEDGGDRRWREIQLPFTISPATSQRLAKIELMRCRQQGVGTFAFNMALYKMTSLDIVAFTLPILGWTGKLLEVNAHRLIMNKQGEMPLLGCELDLQETDPSVYDWNVSEQLAPQGGGTPALPNTREVEPPTSVAAISGSSTTVTGADGISRSRILVSWDPPIDGFVLNGGHMEVRYERVTSPAGTVWTGLPNVDPSVTQVYIDGVTDGQQYVVQVRAVNAAGSSSDWVAAPPVTVSGTASVIPPATIGQGGATTGQVLVWNGTAWVPTTPTGGGGSGGSIFGEIPSGTMNGTNKVFTLSQSPNPPNSLLLFLNGIEQHPGVDYTLSGATITYAVAPLATDWQLANYGIGAPSTASLVIGFVVNDGSTGTNVGPMLAAPRTGAITSCVVTTKTSDGSTGLAFTIKKNGTSIFSAAPTVAAGTASGTVSSVGTLTTTPLTVAVSDVFSIDITGGTSNWKFTAQLE